MEGRDAFTSILAAPFARSSDPLRIRCAPFSRSVKVYAPGIALSPEASATVQPIVRPGA